MNEQLRKMAEQAGLDVTVSMTDEGPVWEGYETQLEAFARLVAMDCAKLCDEVDDGEARRWMGEKCAALIRKKYS